MPTVHIVAHQKPRRTQKYAKLQPRVFYVLRGCLIPECPESWDLRAVVAGLPYITMKYVRPNGWPANSQWPHLFYSDPGPIQAVYFAWRQATFLHRHSKEGEGGADTCPLGVRWSHVALSPARFSAFPLFPKAQPTEGGVNG